MRVVYMGTPQFAARILQGLSIHEDIEIVGVYTNADAVRGRGSKLVASEVKIVAQELGLDVFTPKSFKDDEVHDTLKSLQPDFICVAAYGMLLPQSVLDIPKYECLNVHGSLLPRWRGAAPIQRAIIAGDEYIGVSIMRMETGLDAGDYCIQKPFKADGLDFAKVEHQMVLDGIDSLISAMNSIVEGRVEWTKQDDSKVTFADKLDKKELWINPEMNADDAYRLVLASNDAHSSKCMIANRNVTIESADIDGENIASGMPQGSVVFKNKCLFLAFATGALRINEVKPDGKKNMDAAAFAAGIQNIKSGTVTWSAIDV